MSSFVVAYSTIDRILSFYSKKEAILSEQELTLFGRKMLKLNIDAVNQRYQEGDGYKYAEKYTFNKTGVSQVEAIKALDCFLYQCSEGTCPRRKLFKELEGTRNGWRREVVDNNPEYVNARWG